MIFKQERKDNSPSCCMVQHIGKALEMDSSDRFSCPPPCQIVIIFSILSQLSSFDRATQKLFGVLAFPYLAEIFS